MGMGIPESDPHASLDFTVGPDDTARALGSGDVMTLSTPRLLAWAEAATLKALESDIGAADTSVGTRIEFEHLISSPVGAEIRVFAILVHVDGRLRRFEVVAEDRNDGRVLMHGTITRIVMDRERFLLRTQAAHQ